ARVVHEDVEAPERVDGRPDDVLRAAEVRDAVVACDRLAAATLDDVDHFFGRSLVGALAGDRPAEVVDDDLGAVIGERDRLAAPHAAPRSGDDRDLAVQHSAHLRVLPPGLKTDAGVTVSRSHPGGRNAEWPSTRA